MAIEVFNRCEKKYLITENQYQILLRRISDHMDLDVYNQDNEFYNINNLYYDTMDDRLIRSSIEKPAYKEKMRIRSYGVPSLQDKVYVEIKKKYKGVVNKRRTGMILSEVYQYLNHGIKPDLLSEVNCEMINRQVFSEIDYFKNYYKIEPKVYISYNRKAFYEKNDGDFRITFDKDIITRRYDLKLESGCFGENLLMEGVYLMELKITRAVPLWFTRILSELKIVPTSFSKYGMEYKKYILSETITKLQQEILEQKSQKNNSGYREKGELLCSNQFLQVQQLKMLLASARH